MKKYKFEIEFKSGITHTVQASAFVAGQAVTFYDETFRADIYIKGATYELTDQEKKHLIHILENSIDD